MWPWGHVAVGYLLYSSIVHIRQGRPPDGLAVAALVLGTQFPDLVDKPLAWSFGVLPGGRSLMHSLVTLSVLAVVVHAVARRTGQTDLSFAFILGAFTHPFVDGLKPLLVGEFQYINYLLWPLLGVELPEYYGFRFVVFEPLELLLGYEPIDLDVTLYMIVQLTLFAAAAVLWWRDGAPVPHLLRHERLVKWVRR